MLGFGATHTSIQAAINQAVADGFGGSNPTTILVRPGVYIANVALAAGIHLTAAVPGKAFATEIRGQVTHVSGVVSMLGIDINAVSGGDALTISGNVAATQLYLSDSVVYAYGSDNAAELDVITDGSSGIVFDNVNFRVLSGAGVPINLLRGTVQGRGGTFWPVAETTPALAITGGGTSSTRGRAWLRDPDVFGKVTVTGNGELQVWNGQIRSGSGLAVEDSASGPILLANCAILSSLPAGDVVSSNGGFSYTQVSFVSPFQTMPTTTTRAPGTDAYSTESFRAQLTNAGAPGDLDYTGAVVNTASDVFSVSPNGNVRILKAGVVTVTASVCATCATSPNTSELLLGTSVDEVLINSDLDQAIEQDGSLNNIRKVAVTGSVRVPAGTYLLVRHNGGFTGMQNGLPSTLQITWTGVR